MSESRSVPEEWMVSANFTCLVLRLLSAFSASIFARISRLLSGVRSSCDMLARNSDLYLEVSANCSAFSSSAPLACSTSRFFCSTSVFCSARRRAFSCNSALVRCNCSCWFLSSSSEACSVLACCSEALVGVGQFRLLALQLFGQRLRLLQQLFRSHRGGDGVEHDAHRFGELIEEGEVDVAELVEGRQLDHGFDLSFEQHRQDDDAERCSFAQAA